VGKERAVVSYIVEYRGDSQVVPLDEDIVVIAGRDPDLIEVAGR
jgi:hypothetical protein